MLSNKMITTIGSIVYDMMYYTDLGTVQKNPHDLTCVELVAFERAAKIPGNDLHFTFGGGAANTAITFAQQGLRPQIIGAVGNDELGKACVHNLMAHGVSTTHVQYDPHDKTGVSFVVTIGTKHDHVIFVYRGASAHVRITPHTLTKITTPWIYMTALSHSWQSSVTSVFNRSQQRNCKVAWNPGSEQIKSGIPRLKRFLRHTEVLLVNQDEATELVLSSGAHISSTNPRILVRSLHHYGQRMTVVTCGHKGAYAYDGKTIHYQPAHLGKTVNKTGAGDAFGSGFISGILRHKSIQQSLKLGAYNSGSVVTHIGAQAGILTKRQVINYHL